MELSNGIIKAIRNGEILKAVKQLTSEANLNLRQAKFIIDKYREENQISINISREEKRISELKFEKEKLRDKTYKQKFENKLKEIKEVREKHNFLGYVYNRNLFNELVVIYEQNIKDFEKFYNSNLENFKLCYNCTEKYKSKIHQEHYQLCRNELQEIQLQLNVEDYNINNKSKARISALYKSIDFYEEEYQGYLNILDKQAKLIKEHETHIWLEDLENLQSNYNKMKEVIYGTKLSKDILNIDYSQIQEYKNNKLKQLNEFKDKLMVENSTYKEQLKKFYNTPSSYKDFQKFKTETTKRISDTNTKRTIILVSIIVIILIISFLFFMRNAN